ncbi:MAG: AMP-binding protein [Burkholderiales bacterium]|nr:AMP-binding protein [Burkholderiales bacterium]
MPMTDERTLTRLLQHLAAAHGARPALHYGSRVVSFAELQAESARVASGLARLGVGAGDRVAIWLPNTPAWLACFFACCRLGAIALATNTRFRSSEMEDILGRSEAKVLVYWPAFRGIDFSAIVDALGAASVGALESIVAYSEAGDPDPPPRVHGIAVHRYERLAEHAALASDLGSADRGCLMFTTSGTTKAPKFVLHTQRSIVQHAHDVARGFGYAQPATVGLGVLPFCGTYGFSTGLAPLAAGAPLVVETAFDAERIITLIRRHALTNTNLTGHMIAELLAAAPGEGAFSSIRFCGCGSGSAEVIAPAAAQGLRIAGVYGSSEVQALFAHHDRLEAPLAERAHGGGWPVSPAARVRARDVTSAGLLPHGESGALEIQAPSQFSAYFGNAAASAEAFTDDGFFRTGDLGYTLADGRFIFQARLGDALRLSGFLVSPAQIESVIAEHPSVEACQVVGVETSAGTRPYAFVTRRGGEPFDESAVLAFARARMARYKVPARIVCLEAFPTVQSANAIKVQKARLRDMAESLTAARADQQQMR